MFHFLRLRLLAILIGIGAIFLVAPARGAENLSPLGKELLIKNRILDELRLTFFQGGHLSLFFHKI